MSRIWSKPWITKTSKTTQFGVVRWITKRLMVKGDEIKCGSGKPVNEIDSGREGKRPIWLGHGSM